MSLRWADRTWSISAALRLKLNACVIPLYPEYLPTQYRMRCIFRVEAPEAPARWSLENKILGSKKHVFLARVNGLGFIITDASVFHTLGASASRHLGTPFMAYSWRKRGVLGSWADKDRHGRL